MTDELIELVRERRVIYDSTCKEYRDQFIKNAAWEEIAEILKESVNKCKDDWTKLRNAFASALKRRRCTKSGQAAAPLVPWKYEESMGFLLPYMECRNTKTNVMPTPKSPSTEDSFDESLPANPSTTQSQSRSSFSGKKSNHELQLQELYNLMKSSQDLRREKQNMKQEMDETDLFFLSMSKEIKKLSKLQQTKIKLNLHTTIYEAVIQQLEHSEKTLKTPIIKIAKSRLIKSNQQSHSSTYIPLTPIQTTADIHSATYNQSTATSRSQKHVISNSDDSKRYISSTPQHQSSTFMQTTADVHSATYNQSTDTSRSRKHVISNSDDSKRFISSTPQHQSSTFMQTTADVHSATYNQSTATSRSQKHVSNSDDSQRFISSTPQHQSSTFIQTTADVHSATYNQSTATSRSQKHVSNSDDSQRFIQPTPQHQSSTYLQTPADIQAPIYIQSPIHAQSPTFIQSSPFAFKLNSQAGDLKAYYDSINFDDVELENDG